MQQQRVDAGLGLGRDKLRQVVFAVVVDRVVPSDGQKRLAIHLKGRKTKAVS